MENILFDLDGTLTDSGDGIINSVIFALEKMGIKENDREKLKCFIGPPLQESFQQFYNMPVEKAKEAVSFYREYYKEKGIFENKLYQGIKELFESISHKNIYLATSKPEVFAIKILEYFNIKSSFTYICGSEINGFRTEKNQVIEHVLKQCNLDPKTCIMIGDRKHDILGAKQNNMKNIGVLYGYGDRNELEKAGADVILETVEDLKDYLLKT